MTIFTAPQQLPQDLLLICELVDTKDTQHGIPTLAQNDNDDIASSADESEEIKKDSITVKNEGTETEKPMYDEIFIMLLLDTYLFVKPPCGTEL